ncbi:hypothetical protein DL770_010906 [Monosporascus sp. CRB-9-2]|nr:hypothetical protein DL770_010906 [Monosporascus sp. CRB-9-2]
MADLETAIQRFQDAVEATPKDHPDRARRLESLGTGYRSRYGKTGAIANLETAIQLFQDALNHSSSPTLDRLAPGRNLLTLYSETGNWSLAYLAASTAVSLVPRLTPRSLENPDKQHLLTEIVGLASDTAAVALMAGKTPYEAIRLLELGRGVIVGSLNEMRADITDLQHRHPQVAKEYIKLRDQLDAPATFTDEADPVGTPRALIRQSDQRYTAGKKLEEMIQKIRKLSGFDRFLLAPSEDEMEAAAAPGPIVIINVSRYRCDALIIEKRGLRAVQLPHMDNGEVRARAAALGSDSINTQLLEWLWETTAKPVLDVLGFSKYPRGCWPRIWWIPTGPLAKFPIHAAGYHERGSSETVLDRVISSYSSSVRALMHSRQDRPKAIMAAVSEKVVLVGMQKTPGHDNLPFVRQEIDRLNALCNSMQLQVREPQTNRKEVLAALNDCQIFHFAGHGETDLLDPSKSALLLSDGALTVASLFETNLHSRKPFLAYLSACGTGQVKYDVLIDEGLHLIAACQLAGFRHVVGTLWEVNDMSCVDAATTTYKWMQEGKLSDGSVSEGLHHASRRLRDQWTADSATRRAIKYGTGEQDDGQRVTGQSRFNRDNARDPRHPRDIESCDDAPLNWAPYVHFGV